MSGERTDEEGDLWIFAYGSLMWRPDFAAVAQHKARLSGYHRSLCILSHHYRGTPDQPGLVLGLDRGGSCIGVAFRIAAEAAEATREAVRARELITAVYRETRVDILLDDGTRVRAVTYVADRTHAQYAGKLGRETMLARVRRSRGVAGPNVDYVRNTYHHLLGIGLADPNLAWIIEAVGAEPTRAP